MAIKLQKAKEQNNILLWCVQIYKSRSLLLTNCQWQTVNAIEIYRITTIKWMLSLLLNNQKQNNKKTKRITKKAKDKNKNDSIN